MKIKRIEPGKYAVSTDLTDYTLVRVYRVSSNRPAWHVYDAFGRCVGEFLHTIKDARWYINHREKRA